MRLIVAFTIATTASLLSTACVSSPGETPDTWPSMARTVDVPTSFAPFDVVHVQWKQRLAEPYIYLDHIGDYRQAGPRIAELMTQAADQGAPIAGPPFILFYDDPGITPASALRARIAIAIEGDFTARAPLYLDTLDGANVAYAAIGGPFPDVPRAYSGMLEYMASRGWAARSPIREIYLTSPANTPPSELVTEVQIPWYPGG